MSDEKGHDKRNVEEKQAHHTYRQGGEAKEQGELRDRGGDEWHERANQSGTQPEHAVSAGTDTRRDSGDHNEPAYGRSGPDYGHGAEHEAQMAGAGGRDNPSETGNFAGESSYNQSFREPYGAYQGGYPGEGRSGDGRHSPEYASWRAAQIKKLDDDYEAWCNERHSSFMDEFEEWRKQRNQSASATDQPSTAVSPPKSSANLKPRG